MPNIVTAVARIARALKLCLCPRTATTHLLALCGVLLAAIRASSVAGALSVSLARTWKWSASRLARSRQSRQSFVLSNTASVPLTWAAGVDQTWISLTLYDGVLSGDSSTTVEAFLNSSALYLALASTGANLSFTNVNQPETDLTGL